MSPVVVSFSSTKINSGPGTARLAGGNLAFRRLGECDLAVTNTSAPGDSQKVFMTYRIVLIPGDGIGPEVTAATQRIVEAAGIQVEWETHLAGQSALDQLGVHFRPRHWLP